jgi:hypothetical protein
MLFCVVVICILFQSSSSVMSSTYAFWGVVTCFWRFFKHAWMALDCRSID